ncbi:MAG: hypothetical protein JWL64_2333 [Frankiales bacterium]|nr:hypothetical protein [Frankiales bacterium]
MSEDQAPTVGKGRPTPKRSEREQRRVPVGPPPTTRREAAQRQKARAAEDRAAGRTPGAEPRPMLKRDLGPARALVRDIVDARRNVAIFVLPVLLAFIIAGVTNNQGFQRFIGPLYVASLVVIAFDLFTLGRLIKTRVRTELPGEPLKGLRLYGILRATQMRRLRSPAPRTAPPPMRMPFRR